MGYWLERIVCAGDGDDRTGDDRKNDDAPGLRVLEPDGRDGPQGVRRDARGSVRRGDSSLRCCADVRVWPGGELHGGVPRAASRGGNGHDEVRDSAAEEPGIDRVGTFRGAAAGEGAVRTEARAFERGGQSRTAGGEGELH